MQISDPRQWQGLRNNVEEWEDFVKCIVGNCADIAFAVGGERMMAIEVPALVMELNRRLHKVEEGE